VSKSRLKTPATTVRSREEMEALVGDITKLKINQQSLTADMNERITAVRQKYEGALGDIDEALKGKMALARDWAEAHPAEFGKARSIAMTHGDVGWRLGNPALKTLRGWTWDRVLERLKASLMAGYVRHKEEVDKAGLLADREKLTSQTLLGLGVQVVQEETFFIEPRIEQAENRLQEVAS
jgi:phage host-nuclease inhibitor protein Gam